MGSRTDVAELLSQCRWSEEGSYLGEIAKSGFPCIAKVIRGQYQNIGQPSFSNPSLVSHVLLVSAGKQLSVAAQCVKFKNCRQRVVPFGPTLAIPQNFEGHFEILSEDGRSVPCIPTVSALTRKFPDSCLVREPIKGYKADAKTSSSHGTTTSVTAVVATSTASSDNIISSPDTPAQLQLQIQHQQQHSYKISDKSRVVQPGEILVLVGEVSVPSGKKVSRYLRCFDSKGQTVYLSSSQKGKFSPLARQDSISGVHTTKNILNKRMPMMVRLVDGKTPVTSSAKSSSFKFVPELRLFSTIQEELIFGMPLSHSSTKEPLTLLPLPLSVPLKFQVCRNMGQVDQMKEFCRLQEKIKTLVDQTKNLIQIYDINLKKELRFDGRQWKSYAPPIFLSPSTPDILSAANNNQHHQQLNLTHSSQNNIANNNNYNEIPDVQDYEDIDQIYDYVRGIKPPPPRLTNANNNNDSSSPERKISSSKPPIISHNGNQAKAIMIPPPTHRAKSPISGSVPQGPPPPPVPKHRLLRSSVSVEKLIDDDRPEPPPIETIPTNKNKLLNANANNNSSSNNQGKTNVSSVQLKLIPTNLQSSNITSGQLQSQHQHSHYQQIRSNSEKIKDMKNNKNIKSSLHSSTKSVHPQHHQHPIVAASVNKHSNGNMIINGNLGGSYNSSNASPTTHILSLSSSNNSSCNNTTPTNTSGSSGVGGLEKVRGKHLYVKHHNSHNSSNNNSNNGGLLSADNCISGSPTNRIVFRRSPIFDCRYKSMNDLNRSSLESGASSSSHKLRYFQHNHHGLNVSGGLGLSNLSMNLMNLNMNMKASSARHKGMIFRPKSLTNITLVDDSGGNSGGSKKKLDNMVVPSHHHAIHSPPPPPIELLQKIPRSSQSQRSRKSQQPPPTLYL